MVATKSNMIPLGTKAHPFSLLDTRSREIISFSNKTEGKGFLFAFICNHCPFVIHLKNHFPTLFNQWNKEGLKVYAISANDAVKYPDDSPHKMALDAEEFNFEFPYLFDETQEIAKLYGAVCTPDFFLYDGNQKLYYRGQYDSSRPGIGEEPTGNDLINAVSLLLSGKNSPSDQRPSLGCNIKWK